MVRRLLWSMMLAGVLSGPTAVARDVLYGFTPFPYDLTLEAVEGTWEFTLENSTLFALHMDACVPWNEILAEAPFPQWLQQDWSNSRARIPAGRPVYIAITPTKTDRVTAAFACGQNEGEELEPPAAIGGVPLDDPGVMQAYLDYARRVISGGDMLNVMEEDDRKLRVKQFLDIGISFDLTEKEMVTILYRELFTANK